MVPQELMMHVAAIWYVIDQNEPSYPQLVELSCSENPTKEEVEKAAVDFYMDAYDNASMQYQESYGEAFPAPKLSVEWNHTYGDVAVYENDDDGHFYYKLFIGLPLKLRYKFGLISNEAGFTAG